MKQLKDPTTLVALITTAIVSIFATVMTTKTEGTKSRDSRISELEDQRDELAQDKVEMAERHAEETTALQAIIYEQRLRQATAKTRPLESMYSLLEAIQKPAWVKVYNPDNSEFRMLYINSDYERQYDRTRALYLGKTDFEVYPKDIADVYYRHDMQVIQTKSWNEFIETGRDVYRKQGQFVFWKFFVDLPDGREVVVGIQIRPAEAINGY